MSQLMISVACFLLVLYKTVLAANYCQWANLESVDYSGGYLGYSPYNKPVLFPSSLCSGNTCTFAIPWGNYDKNAPASPANGNSYNCDGNIHRNSFASTSSTLDEYYVCTCQAQLPILQGPKGSISVGLADPSSVFSTAGPWPVQDIFCMFTSTRITTVSVSPTSSGCLKYSSCHGTVCGNSYNGSAYYEDCSGATTGPANLLPNGAGTSGRVDKCMQCSFSSTCAGPFLDLSKYATDGSSSGSPAVLPQSSSSVKSSTSSSTTSLRPTTILTSTSSSSVLTQVANVQTAASGLQTSRSAAALSSAIRSSVAVNAQIALTTSATTTPGSTTIAATPSTAQSPSASAGNIATVRANAQSSGCAIKLPYSAMIFMFLTALLLLSP